MNDFIKSIKAALYERAVSPLAGAFFLSWLAWNYRMIFVLFSSMEVDEKLDYIDCFLYPGTQSYLLQWFLGPFLTSLVVIFIYPLIAEPVFKYSRNRQRRLHEIRQEIEEETPLTLEQSREIRKEMYDQQGDFDEKLKNQEKALEDKGIHISVLEKEVKNLKKNSISELDKTSDNTVSNAAEKLFMIFSGKKKMYDLSLMILEEIANKKSPVNKEMIYSSVPFNHLEVDFVLDYLLTYSYIMEETMDVKYFNNIGVQEEKVYKLTQDGREVVIGSTKNNI